MMEQQILQVPELDAARVAEMRMDLMARAESIQRRRRRRRDFGLCAAAAVTIAGLGYANLSPTSSYASWTAIPTPVEVSLSDPNVTECLEAVPQGPSASVGRVEPRPILAEVRGEFTAVLLAASDNVSVCIADQTTRASARTTSPALEPGRVISVDGNGGSLDEDGARYVYGRVTPGVVSVEVRTDDGTRVAASVRQGYYLAWWPAPAGPASVRAEGQSGLLETVTP